MTTKLYEIGFAPFPHSFYSCIHDVNLFLHCFHFRPQGLFSRVDEKIREIKAYIFPFQRKDKREVVCGLWGGCLPMFRRVFGAIFLPLFALAGNSFYG